VITKADIEKLAKLSRLKLTEDEKEKYAKDMENILAYVKQIDGVSPTSGVGATAGASLKSSYAPAPTVGDTRNIMHDDDKPHESGIFTEELLKLAPRSENNRVKVKKIL